MSELQKKYILAKQIERELQKQFGEDSKEAMNARNNRFHAFYHWHESIENKNDSAIQTTV